MVFRVLGLGVGILFLSGCASWFQAKDASQVDETPICPTFELVLCPVPAEPKAPVTPVCPEPVEPVQNCPVVYTPDGRLRTLGEIEYVDILPAGFRQKARIDTGAETTSIEVHNIVEFERDGKPWVKFALRDRITEDTIELKAQIQRQVLTKQPGKAERRRLVVQLNLAIGDLKDEVDVILVDSESHELPILVGRNFLQGRAVVDVSRKFQSLENEL